MARRKLLRPYTGIALSPLARRKVRPYLGVSVNLRALWDVINGDAGRKPRRTTKS